MIIQRSSALAALLFTSFVCVHGASATPLTDTTANFSFVQGTYNPSGVTPGSVNGADPGVVPATAGVPGTYTYGWYQFAESNSVPSVADPVNSGTFVPFSPAQSSAAGYHGPFGYTNGGPCCTSEASGYPFVGPDGSEHGIVSTNAGFTTTTNVPSGAALAPAKIWVSDYTGTVSITGTYQSTNACCGSAQTPDLYVNNTLMQLTPIGALNTGGTTLHTYELDNVTLHAGDLVQWVMDPGHNFYGNSTSFTGTINATPEPASASLLMLAGIGVLARRRRV